jgi:murein hydrolase activator
MQIFAAKKISIYSIIIFIIGISVIVTAQKVNYKNQDRGELEKQRTMILAEIKETQAKLSELQKDKNATMAQLNALQSKLTAREALISNINKDISLLENNITSASTDVKTLTLSLDELKKQYAELIRYTYKNRASQSVIIFLFSARNFNDAVRRYNYVKQYREYRRQQAEKAKDEMLNAQVEQQQVLALESTQKNAVVLNLKGQEKGLIENIAIKRRTAEAVNKAINTAIKREIEIARKKAEEERRKAAFAKAEAARKEKERIQAETAARKKSEVEAKRQKEENEKAKNMKAIAGKKPGATSTARSPIPAPKPVANNFNPKPPAAAPSSSYNDDLTDESRALSSSFESNRGNLSSPVTGYVCSHFGKNKHPVFNVVEENYGVDIRTAKGAIAKSVFGGEVSSVFFIAGAGNCVMVNHGNYFTVYSKLDKVNVSKGQKIAARTAIGSVMTDAEGNNQVHFEIWKVNANGSPMKLNPEQWIRM